MLWELPDETVEKFVDDKGYVYATCVYEKGEPKYILTKKRIWEKTDEVESIMMAPNLSE